MSKDSVFLLVDCNNFFVSCERVFNPLLRNRPVVVLSNNDGCVIARSNEAKILGVPMGVPLYQIRDLVQRSGIVVMSSNFNLYGELSARVMQILRSYAETIEVYSVDEAFLSFEDSRYAEEDWLKLAAKIRCTIWQYLGLPVSIGMAHSKTLAKVAVHKIKKTPSSPGYYYIRQALEERASLLSSLSTSDIWGIGRRWASALKAYGIDNAWQLHQANPKLIRQKFNVFLARTQLELQGISCFEIERFVGHKKSIAVTRSFGEKITDYVQLEQAVTFYLSKLGEKLRREKVKTNQLIIYIRTNKYSAADTQYSSSEFCQLPTYTNFSDRLIHVGVQMLKKIYKPGLYYSKAGVMAFNLLSESIEQEQLFANDLGTLSPTAGLMSTLDRLNNKHGRGTVSYAVTGLHRNWLVRSNHRSPNYLTSWEELLEVKA